MASVAVMIFVVFRAVPVDSPEIEGDSLALTADTVLAAHVDNSIDMSSNVIGFFMLFLLFFNFIRF
jgi:hypothetical protein